MFLITIDDDSFKRSKHSENDRTGEDPRLMGARSPLCSFHFATSIQSLVSHTGGPAKALNWCALADSNCRQMVAELFARPPGQKNAGIRRPRLVWEEHTGKVSELVSIAAKRRSRALTAYIARSSHPSA